MMIFPAEWNRQWAVQLTWPHAETDWKPYLEEITHTYLEMARAIAARELLIVVAQDAEAVSARLASEGIDMSRVIVHACPTNDTWARDHGFLVLAEEPASGDACSAKQFLDFKFNGWGEKFEADKDNAINRSLFATISDRYPCGSGMSEPTVGYQSHLDFVLEGGSIESDGKGTVLTTSCCLLAPHRNQPLTRSQIEEQLKARLQAKRILWIDHGHLTGDDTDGHIDTLVRMAPDDTLLYMGCDDPRDEQFDDLKAMEAQLKTLLTADGKPFRLLKLPSPSPVYDEGERLPATYANFLVINGAVLVPTYAQPGTDREALRVIQQAFPDREMIPIDSRTIIRQHGSIHCCTMQFPL